MKSTVNIIVFSFLSFSVFCCSNGSKSNNQGPIASDSIITKNTCNRILMEDVLFRCIDSYINDYPVMSPTKDWMYYSLLFFKENNKEYFTIWFFVVFPDIVISDQLDTAMYNYDMDIIQDRKVVIVSKKDENNNIFKPTVDSRDFAKHDRNNRVSPSIYDGDWYFQTYEVIHNGNGGYTLKETDSANVFFNPTLDGSTKILSAGRNQKVF